MEKCKVVGCSNSVMEIRDSVRHETMFGLYGYCQTHNIDGLVDELKKEDDTDGKH